VVFFVFVCSFRLSDCSICLFFSGFSMDCICLCFCRHDFCWLGVSLLAWVFSVLFVYRCAFCSLFFNGHFFFFFFFVVFAVFMVLAHDFAWFA